METSTTGVKKSNDTNEEYWNWKCPQAVEILDYIVEIKDLLSGFFSRYIWKKNLIPV